jgi:4-diphosphocytidyl-2-C-methyl-D-erythritol kinase
MTSFTLRAFAKINLSLRLKHVREDGFHEVQTFLQAIDVYDRLTFETRRGPFELRCGTPGVPLDRTNLVWKAAQLLWTAAGRDGDPRDVSVTLEKNIPMQAGLGGGSSDGAAALLGLLRAWKLRIPEGDLAAIAARLGSDVPYFLVGGTALGLGSGEEVYPLVDLPRMWVVLAMPNFGIATRDAYAWWDAEQWVRPLVSIANSASHKKKGLTRLFNTIALGNDLETPVMARYPAIADLKSRLEGHGALTAAMSGSGSTVFGVFRSEASARRAARAIRRPDADTRCARFLPRRRA